MEEALKRLQEAEAYNQQQMQQLQRAWALSDYEEEKQEELQQRVLELRAACLREQSALEQQLQQTLQKTTEQIEAEKQQFIADLQENVRRCQEQVVDQIVEGVIQTYGSHETK